MSDVSTTPEADPVAVWHEDLQNARMRGDRAALRRAQTPADADGIGALYTLLWSWKPGIPRGSFTNSMVEIAARTALAVAMIDTDTTPEPDTPPDGKEAAATQTGETTPQKKKIRNGDALGRALAALDPRRNDKNPRYSQDRLRRLLSAEDPDEFLRLLRSAILQLDRAAPVTDVSRVMEAWHHPDARAKVRRQIFLSYFAALPLPDSIETPDTTDTTDAGDDQ